MDNETVYTVHKVVYGYDQTYDKHVSETQTISTTAWLSRASPNPQDVLFSNMAKNSLDDSIANTMNVPLVYLI